MIGIIIVTHGNLALELKSAMEHILGIQKNIEIISIKPDDDLEIKKSALEESIKKVDEENGVIILTDMFGGTPSNLAKFEGVPPNMSVKIITPFSSSTFFIDSSKADFLISKSSSGLIDIISIFF